MASISEMALKEAQRLDLDLSIKSWLVPTSAFSFQCLEPSEHVLQAFGIAKAQDLTWVNSMPVPVLTYHARENKYRIMDGMMRICAAKSVGIEEIPALVANGDTYDALKHILDHGYYGEDFVEMLAMVDAKVNENLDKRDRNRLAGK